MKSQSNEYENIDSVINKLFDYVYNKKSEEDYDHRKINAQELNLNNVKFPVGEKTTQRIVDDIFNGSVKWFKEERGIHVLKRLSNSAKSCTLKMMIYQNDEGDKNLHQRENMHKVVSILLRDLVLERRPNHVQTKLLMLPIVNVDITSKQLQKIIDEDSENLKSLQPLADSGKVISVEVSEHYFRVSKLSGFLRKNSLSATQWKVLFFQLIFLLSIIQNRYAGFRHNDMRPNNIDIYEKNESGKMIKYLINGQVYSVPEIGMELKLGNFYQSAISGIHENESVKWGNKQNRYADLHFFLNTLLTHPSYQDIVKDSPLQTDSELIDFLQHVIPDTLRGKEARAKEEHVLPLDILLNHNIFREFRSLAESKDAGDKAISFPGALGDTFALSDSSFSTISDSVKSRNVLIAKSESKAGKIKSHRKLAHQEWGEVATPELGVMKGGARKGSQKTQVMKGIRHLHQVKSSSLPRSTRQKIALSSEMSEFSGGERSEVASPVSDHSDYSDILSDSSGLSSLAFEDSDVKSRPSEVQRDSRAPTSMPAPGKSNGIASLLGSSKGGLADPYAPDFQMQSQVQDINPAEYQKYLSMHPVDDAPVDEAPVVETLPETSNQPYMPEAEYQAALGKLGAAHGMPGMSAPGMPGMSAPGMPGMSAPAMPDMKNLEMPVTQRSAEGAPQLNNQQTQEILKQMPSGFQGEIPPGIQMMLPQLGGYNGNDFADFNHDFIQSGGKLGQGQKGGGAKVVPKYRDTKNSPFRTNQEKESQAKHYQEATMHSAKDGKPLMEFKVSNELLQGAKGPPPKMIMPQPFVPVPNPYYPAQNPELPWGYQQNNVPLVKNYNISLSGPGGDHYKISALYEDMLPAGRDGKEFVTMDTISERLSLYQFIRSSLLDNMDGENISIADGDTRRQKNLLGYLKFMEINPYHHDSLTANPYQSIPDNMVLYRSAYPIRFDPKFQRVISARKSTGMNIRLYDLSMGELYANQIDAKITHFLFDSWREIAYYEHIREEVIKKNRCPNFITLYGYYLATDAGIDFNKIRMAKRKLNGVGIDSKNKDQLMQVYKIVAQKLNIQRSPESTLKLDADALKKEVEDVVEEEKKKTPLGPMGAPLTSFYAKGMIPHHIKSKNYRTNKLDVTSLTPMTFSQSSGHTLIALTESPTTSLISWASRVYQKDGTLNLSVNKMIQSGFHDQKVWRSVIFQIVAALYVLQKEEIGIENMTLKDNVYLKDLGIKAPNVGYWKYIVDGYEYFVPNHGSLALIDTNFKEIEYNRTLMGRSGKDIKYKIYANMFDGTDNASVNQNHGSPEIREMVFENFKRIINPDNFGKSFLSNGGVMPPAEIMSLLGSMYTQASQSGASRNIADYLKSNMQFYLNNRIGTYLTREEINNIVDDRSTSLRKGEVLVYEKGSDAYNWVLYDGISPAVGGTDSIAATVNILTKEYDTDNTYNKKLITKQVPRSSLRKYSSLEPIKQNYKALTIKISEENMMATYYID